MAGEILTNKACCGCGGNELHPDTLIGEAVDMVNAPPHYTEHYPFEVTEDAIKALLMSLTDDLTAYQIYCLGNELKYRFRAGLKGDAAEDIKKAMRYSEMRRER